MPISSPPGSRANGMGSQPKRGDTLVCLLFGITSLAGSIWFYFSVLNFWLPW